MARHPPTARASPLDCPAPRIKPYVLRPKAREERRAEVRYYWQEAGAAVAKKLIEATASALEELTQCLHQLSQRAMLDCKT